jgi:acyl-CoA synthetase (AMP-forming)/AMP-acid ligase II
VSTVRALLERQVRERPDAVYALETEGPQQITFAALAHSCQQAAALLRAHGASPGETVSLVMPNGLTTLQLLLGAMHGGWCVNPVNLLSSEEQMGYVLNHSDCTLVIASPEWAETVRRVLLTIPREIALWVCDAHTHSFAEDVSKLPDHPAHSVTPQDHALLMYTSGTTGVPKGVLLSQANLAANAASISAEHALTAQDRVLAVLPLYHINAFAVTMLAPLFHGGSLAMPPKFSAARFWQQALQSQCTWINVVPTMISYLLEGVAPDASQTARIQFCRSASAALPPAHLQAFEAKFGIGIIETMGLTETVAPAFSNPLVRKERKLGSVGKASGCEACVIDSAFQVVADGVTGEVAIRGPQVMQGYYKNETATRESFTPDGWLRTGDLGHRDSDGFFFITGRIKELIIKGGENIAPREIDEVLLRHPGVLDAAAVGVPDPHYGQDILVCVIAREGQSVTDAILREHCTSLLGRFKTPKYFCMVQDLPRGPSGKVQRLKLPDLPECKVLLG